jgi:hypothetical protein
MLLHACTRGSVPVKLDGSVAVSVSGMASSPMESSAQLQMSFPVVVMYHLPFVIYH